MAATGKFDLSSSSADGATHPIGQRETHVAASLERLGSFREAVENRVSSSSTSRTGSVPSQIDMVNLVQNLLTDLPMMVSDQLSPRPRELRKLISSIIGISQEDSLPAAFSAKPLPSSAVEEIRRLISCLQEGSVKARDRAKAFGEVALKMDKCSGNTSRKRSRSDIPSSERSNTTVPGASSLKMGAHGHFTARALEVGPQKSEERAKSGAPSRKIRTSFTEMDACPSKIARPSASMDRDRDVLKLANSGVTPSEEKGRALASAVDGWDNSKTKKKRSVIKSDPFGNAVLVRPHENDRESKRGMQQKLTTEARPRLNNTHGFRSGPASGITGAGKLDSASQPNGIGVRRCPRNDQDNGSLPNDRRDRFVSSDKEGAAVRAASKPNCCEESYAASPTSTMKINASVRGPRSNSGSLSKTASPNMNCASGNFDDCEHPDPINKLTGGVINCKRSTSVCSSSPPVANWGGQRHQKTRVARRSNLPPVASKCDDFTSPDIQGTMAVNDDGFGIMRCPSVNASLQSISRVDQLPFTGLSEGEQFGVVDNKAKDKSKKCNEMEERAGASVQKAASLLLPSRKSKVATEEDQDDGVGRHGKISRISTPARSGMSASNEKLDGVATAKQVRSTRISYEKSESKPGRPLTKKWSERKGQSRPRHTLISAPSIEFAGESDGDHEELLAAANAALNTMHQVCLPPSEQDQESSSRKKPPSIWEKNEDIFCLLSVEDEEFLSQQIRDEATASVCGAGDGQGMKDDFECNSLPSTPLTSKDGYDESPNGTISLNEHMRVIKPTTHQKNIEPFLEELGLGNGAQTGVSLCQALLSAIIEEEDIEVDNHKNSNEEEHSCGNAYGLHVKVDAELKSNSLNLQSFWTFRAADRVALYSYKATGWGYHDELILEDLGCNGAVDDLVPSLTITSSPICPDFQYSQMCIGDRILLELSEIGVHPEPVPYLASCEDEDIGEGINRLMVKLHEQVSKKKRMLSELEKVVKEARKSQGRELERIALDKLVGRAYEKYMACRGPKACGSKSMNRANKQATLAFVQRTLARYQRFVETGTSCFSEPAFRDMFYSASSNNGVSKTAMNLSPFTSGRQTEISLADRNHGQASQSAQRDYNHIKYPDSFRSVNHLTEQTCGRDDQWSNKLKKKELLLDEVVGSATDILGASSSLGSSTKGKRSDREREGKGQNRDSASGNSTAKVGRPSTSHGKGERKNKSKPKQKMTQLSSEMPNDSVLPSAPKSRGNADGSTKKEEEGAQLSNHNGMNDLSNDAATIDFGDFGDLGGQGQDIGSWLNIEEDALQDHDFMGLEIPMDDLSEVMF